MMDAPNVAMTKKEIHNNLWIVNQQGCGHNRGEGLLPTGGYPVYFIVVTYLVTSKDKFMDLDFNTYWALQCQY